MDPITAIGAVASIIQLAGTALSLSKSLYEVSSLTSNASDDICSLAHDLSLFSESLLLLSKMLDANKEMYAEGVYGLTAKIIVDCGKICGKIEKLVKKCQNMRGLGGKLRWMVSERKIKVLMERLRDMKITLLIIVSNLQLDRQLSLMSVPSASTIEKPSEQHAQSLLQCSTDDVKISSYQPRPPSSHGILKPSSISTFKSPDPEVPIHRVELSVPTQSPSLDRGLRSLESMESFVTAVSFQQPEQPKDRADSPNSGWRNEMAKTASNHFQMSDTEARAWASNLPSPYSPEGLGFGFSGFRRLSAKVSPDRSLETTHGQQPGICIPLHSMRPRIPLPEIVYDDSKCPPLIRTSTLSSGHRAKKLDTSRAAKRAQLREDSVLKQRGSGMRPMPLPSETSFNKSPSKYSNSYSSYQFPISSPTYTPNSLDAGPPPVSRAHSTNSPTSVLPLPIKATKNRSIYRGSVLRRARSKSDADGGMLLQLLREQGEAPNLGGNSGFLQQPQYQRKFLPSNMPQEQQQINMGIDPQAQYHQNQQLPMQQMATQQQYANQSQVNRQGQPSQEVQHQQHQFQAQMPAQQAYAGPRQDQQQHEFSLPTISSIFNGPALSSLVPQLGECIIVKSNKRGSSDVPERPKFGIKKYRSGFNSQWTTVENHRINNDYPFESAPKRHLSALSLPFDVIIDQVQPSGHESLWGRAYAAWVKTPLDKQLPQLLQSNNLWSASSPEESNTSISTFCAQRDLCNNKDSRLMEVSAVMKVVSESIGLGTASAAWAGFAFLFHLIRDTDFYFAVYPSDSATTTLHLVTIASIIARYTVMEHIYHAWTGMTLGPEFETELEHLCALVFEYMDAALQPLHTTLGARAVLHIYDKFTDVVVADRKCRSFNISLVTENIAKDVVRFGDISSDDSDGESDASTMTMDQSTPVPTHHFKIPESGFTFDCDQLKKSDLGTGSFDTPYVQQVSPYTWKK